MNTLPVTPSEPNKLHVFVSHMWVRDDAYRKLVGLLEHMFGESLVDHSIPIAAALRLMSSGPQALEEEQQLQHTHLKTCTDQLQAESDRRADLSKQVSDLKRHLNDRRKASKVWGVCTQPRIRRTSSWLNTAGRRASLLARSRSNKCQLRCSTWTKKKRMPQ